MKVDKHQAKASRKWKQKHGMPTGGPSQPRSHRGEASDDVDDEEIEDDDDAPRRSFGKRKITSNASRYDEPEEEPLEEEEKDAQEIERLQHLLRSGDEQKDAATYFHFSAEKEWVEDDEDGKAASSFDDLFALDIDDLTAAIAKLPVDVRLGIDFSEFPEIIVNMVKIVLGTQKPVTIKPKNKSAYLDSWEYSKDSEEKTQPVLKENPVKAPTQTAAPAKLVTKPERERQQGPSSKAAKSTSDAVPLSVPYPSKPVAAKQSKPAGKADLDDMLFEGNEKSASSKPKGGAPPSQPKKTIAKTSEKDELDWLDDILSK
ncbi:hypothetical protein HDU97_004832 [Phlyctochytrium planicorne]|nr:hypothetical protein HDU97_004832 [Phlyctochytrium planicorne]